MNTLRKRCALILSKLKTVRNRHLSCFGDRAHGFYVAETLSDSAISAIEDEHEVILPEEYRAFLLHVGDGGAGPYYGIYAVEDASKLGVSCFGNSWSAPCPLELDGAYGSDCAPSPDHEWEDKGTLALGTQGCAYDNHLVLNGPHRGRVVYLLGRAVLAWNRRGTLRDKRPLPDIVGYLDPRTARPNSNAHPDSPFPVGKCI